MSDTKNKANEEAFKSDISFVKQTKRNSICSEICPSLSPPIEKNGTPLECELKSELSFINNEKLCENDNVVDSIDYKSLWIEYIGGQSAVDSLGLKEKEIQKQIAIYKMIESEKKYCSYLSIIIQYYMNPLRLNNLLNKKDLNALFSNIEQINGVNKQLLSFLEKRQQENKCITEISDIWLTMHEYLKMYNLYCGNYTFAITKLEDLKNSKSIAKFLNNQATRKETESLSLDSLLIKPVQRIAEYPYYLKDILKYTDESDNDYENLTKAYSKLEIVVKIVKENSKAAESFYNLVAFQNRFSPKINILSPYRKLKFKCEIDVYMKKMTSPTHVILEALSNKKSIDKQKRLLFIFNDLIIIAKSLSDEPDKLDKGKLKLIQKREYSDVEVRNIKNSSIFNCSLNTKGKNANAKNTSSNSISIPNDLMHSIEITFYNPEILFIIFFDSEESKNKILNYLMSYIKVYRRQINKNESEPNIIKSIPSEKIYTMVNGMEKDPNEEYLRRYDEERSPSPVKSAKSTQSFISSRSVQISSGSLLSSKSENLNNINNNNK